MINKLFGKYAGIASCVIMTIIAICKVYKPDLIDTELAISIMGALGIHAGASASAIGK